MSAIEYEAGEDIKAGDYIVMREADGKIYKARKEDAYMDNIYQASTDITEGQKVSIQANQESNDENLIKTKNKAKMLLHNILGYPENFSSEVIGEFVELVISAAVIELAVVIDEMRAKT